MCDELSHDDNERYRATRRHISSGKHGGLEQSSRGRYSPVFGMRSAIETPDGIADSFFVAPTKGKYPGILVWPDVMGLRPAFEEMAKRVAQEGYAVLVVNQFYRNTEAPFLKPGEDWRQPDINAKITSWGKALTQSATASDAKIFIDWLDKQKSVDTSRGIGCAGYCLGGPMMMITAAAIPDRIRAGASFHGVALATDKLDSPHLLVPLMKAECLFAIAENDDERNPREKERLRGAFSAFSLAAEIEVYDGAMHGWCAIDSRVFHRAQAERAWARQLALFDRAL
ncbi:dienelactone hydrolase family protein [Bradyrhizobium sp. 41S5]|uniref:dienelactone hydrolase family protein n=1 Tax=Bradyrhizobium sp. 41S5 TaxID=1404443 RepID=UPI00156AD946|nr:dienelactone hydrolase family protein [Bradyrhizobium sp. 41S5]UFX42752.1 dienelactone hydrolase family protein [Bradyrhizobium sp. 41S5]